jgi:hypothetical protein
MGIIKLEIIWKNLMEKQTRKGWVKERANERMKNEFRKRMGKQRRRKISGRNDNKRENFIVGTSVPYTVSRIGI